jgi:drug/metabolite transporter (DMT)-like permease
MRRSGFLYMAASAAFFSGMGVLVKIAGRRLPLAEIVLVRVVITLILSWVMVRRAGLVPWGNNRVALVARGLLGFAALSCFYWTLTHIPLAEATTIQNLSPIFTAIGAMLWLRERAGIAAYVAILLGIAGTVMIAQPGHGSLDMTGLVISIGGAAASGAAYVTVRQLSKDTDPLIVVFYFPLVSLPLAIPWTVPNAVWPTACEWLVLIGIGILTQGAQVSLTRALTLEKAARAAAVGYLQVALASLWGLAFFGEVPGLSTIGGMALIIGGTALVASTSRCSGR